MVAKERLERPPSAGQLGEHVEGIGLNINTGTTLVLKTIAN